MTTIVRPKCEFCKHISSDPPTLAKLLDYCRDKRSRIGGVACVLKEENANDKRKTKMQKSDSGTRQTRRKNAGRRARRHSGKESTSV
jgi:hypothetical protein